MDDKFWVAFNTSLKIGPARFKKLYSYFDTLQDAWNASESEFIKAGLDRKVISEINQIRKKINPDKEFEKVQNEGIEVITIKDKKYPAILKEIYNPPALLYIKGAITSEDEIALAVVGTRQVTQYGVRVTPKLVEGLSQNGLTIISGLALGIDALAHESALKSGGRTIAVLAGGIDEVSIYPHIHKKLAHEVIENGAVISEQHIGTPCFRDFFPARNRIISGLSLGVLVIEAAERSGALITAQQALEQGREVFAVPGSIFSPASIGPNNLVKLGAKMVTDYSEILTELTIDDKVKSKISREILPETSDEQKIFKILTENPIHIDKISKMVKMPSNQVSSALTLMEIKGMIKNIGAGNYIKNV
jgi:DNA processing protein